MSDDQPMLDNTPHPRILRMLGQIKFAPWQCIAELVDNSIDGFLEMKRRGIPIVAPYVNVAFGRETVTVIDNGSGMNFEMLEKAVRAGFSSQTEEGSLGLYGMGFNIATAVLGSLTTIWTTRAGDDEWYGTEIDLVKLAETGRYGIPRLRRDKTFANESGTHVVVTKIKPELKDNFVKDAWVRTNISDRMRKIYSTMLRDKSPQPLGFQLEINRKRLVAKEHCIWPADWSVYRQRDGVIYPFREFDTSFGTLYRNRVTGETFGSLDDITEDVSMEDIVEIQQRVYGWIGIQRYTDEKEYGFDLIRNGRKIETDCKAFFTWEDAEGNEKLEYPVDDQRVRAGRIVGEAHLDHGYVYYTKDHFERSHISWQHLDAVIRGRESLTNREKFGFKGLNESPLGLIQRTFRRNTPAFNLGQTWWDILCLKENGLAKQWAEEWRKGTPAYRNESKWQEKLKSYDAPTPILGNDGAGNGSDAPSPSDDPILNGGTNSANIVSDQTDASGGNSEGRVIGAGYGGEDPTNVFDPAVSTLDTKASSKVPAARPLTKLNIRITGVGTRGSTYDVEAFEEDQTPGGLFSPPWRIQSTARGVYEFYVNAKHSVFDSSTLQVRDAILAEMAHIITNEEDVCSSGDQNVSFAETLVSLRDKFSNTDSLDVTRLTCDIEDIRTEITKRLSSSTNETERKTLVETLPDSAVEEIELDAANRRVDTPVTDYFRMADLLYLMDRNAKMLFEAGCFNRQWTPMRLANNSSLLEAHRARLVRNLTPLLSTLTEFGRVTRTDHTRDYLLYIRASVNRLREFLSDDLV